MNAEEIKKAFAEEFPEVLIDEPRYLFAAADRDGRVWVYQSVIVKDDDELFQPVRDRIAELGYAEVSREEWADDGMMFHRATERVFGVAR